MTYNSIADMAGNIPLRQRCTAAAAQENKPKPYEGWVDDHRWELAATPGWSEAWDSAVAGGNPNPGADEAVITDGMILAAVQPMGGA
jgi:hypothetical protein